MLRLVLLALPLLAATSAHAQATSEDHSGHSGQAMTDQAEPPSTQAFRQANAVMHSGMEIAYTGNADVDFIRGMIPHHQGAVEMARVVLEHGKDPEVRKLAEAVIAAQTTEIDWMQDWLARNGD